MSTKILLRWVFISSLVGTVLLVLVGTAPVLAQCGEPPTSSCATCHAQEDPVSEKGEWHIIHASKDICINCHGGNATAVDKDLAHESLTANPLSDIYTDCHSCHPDFDERAQIFASTLGVTPGSCATPTYVLVSNTSNEPPSGGIHAPTNLISRTTTPQSILVTGAMILFLTIFIFGLGWLEKHPMKS